MKVGFIGLGIMGKPMSKNLVKAGHELVVCDFKKESVEELKALGAKGAANGAGVARECQVIITMVPNSPNVREVVFGEGGIAEAAKPGTVLIDMSSIDPVESKRIGEELAAKGIEMLDAPVPLTAQMMEIMQFLKSDWEVKVIETSQSVTEAREAIERGAGVIVARGLQADLIREYTKVPLVEICLTGQEMGLLIEEAKVISRKKMPQLAFIGHKTMFPDTSYMNEIFHVDLRIYAFENWEALGELVRTAVLEGADVVIGGERALGWMERYSVPALFLRAREDSIRKALHVAAKVLYTSQVEKENRAQFMTVLDTVYNGVLKVDRDKRITTVNHAAEQILGKPSRDLAGHSLAEAMPALEISYIDKVLEGKRDVFTTTVNIREHSYLVSVAPIAYDSQITGTILSMNRLPNRASGRSEEFSGNYLLGYFTDGDFRKIVTRSELMKQEIELAKSFALSESPVIIYGETGTEKELFAQGIHCYGYQKNGPYVTVNCSGMTEEQQLEALFGKVEESGKERKGALRLAAYGTLLIRDIEELSLRCQYRLLRIMRYKVFMKTDVEETPAMEVRILATSRKDLSWAVKRGCFREDLYYLFHAFSLHIPPLRKRKEDLPELVASHISRYNERYARRVSLTKGGLEAFCEYDWPGNALQLERVCERVVLTSLKRSVDEVMIRELLQGITGPDQEGEEKKGTEAQDLKRALARYGGSREKTAKALGISTTTLWRRMKRYGIS